jgi:uncharacterized membrane protein
MLCRAMKLNFPTIALAFAFFAANGAIIKYSQEVRMYSLLLCLSLFSLWLFVRFLNLGKSFWILTVINVLLIYTHYFGWFVVLSEVAVILILQRIKIRQILIMLGINLLAFVPWILTVWNASKVGSQVGQNIGWIGKPKVQTLFQFVFDLFEPFYFQQSNVNATSIFYITIPLLLIFVTAAIYYFSDWEKLPDLEKRDFYVLLIFTAVPIFLVFTASWLLPYSIWGTRHLIIVFAPLLILLSVFLNKINLQKLKIVFASLLFLLFAVAFILQIKNQQTTFIWCGWENLAQNIDTREPQKIYAFEDEIAYLTWFALRESDRVEVVKVNIEGLKEDKAYFLPRGFDKVQRTGANGIEGERFWIAFRAKEFNENEPPLRNLIIKGYKIGEPKFFEAQGLKAFLVLVEK